MTLPELLLQTASINIDLSFSRATLLCFLYVVLLSMFPLLLSLHLLPVFLVFLVFSLCLCESIYSIC